MKCQEQGSLAIEGNKYKLIGIARKCKSLYISCYCPLESINQPGGSKNSLGGTAWITTAKRIKAITWLQSMGSYLASPVYGLAYPCPKTETNTKHSVWHHSWENQRISLVCWLHCPFDLGMGLETGCIVNIYFSFWFPGTLVNTIFSGLTNWHRVLHNIS